MGVFGKREGNIQEAVGTFHGPTPPCLCHCWLTAERPQGGTSGLEPAPTTEIGWVQKVFTRHSPKCTQKRLWLPQTRAGTDSSMCLVSDHQLCQGGRHADHTKKSLQHISLEQWWALPWQHAWWSHLGTACQKHSDQHKNTAVQQLKKTKPIAQQLSWGETTQGPRQHQEWLLTLAEDMEEEVSEPQNQRGMQANTEQVWEELEGEGGCVLPHVQHLSPKDHLKEKALWCQHGLGDKNTSARLSTETAKVREERKSHQWRKTTRQSTARCWKLRRGSSTDEEFKNIPEIKKIA